MKASDIHDLLVSALVRQGGGTRRRWRMIVGAVRVYDPATHPHCNWSVAPSGDPYENDAVERLLDGFRLDHPLADRD